MEHFKYPTNQQPSQHANMHGESIYYRNFNCRFCKASVNVCNQCDCGEIYCPNCKPVQKRTRIRRALNKYKKSRRGRFKRAASSKRRRDKIKLKKEQHISLELPDLNKIEGDRGPPDPQVLNRTPEPALSAEQKTEGVPGNVQFPHQIFNSSTDIRKRSPPKTTQILCSFCKRVCAPFQRQKKGRLGTKEKKDFQRWRARSWGKDP